MSANNNPYEDTMMSEIISMFNTHHNADELIIEEIDLQEMTVILNRMLERKTRG